MKWETIRFLFLGNPENKRVPFKTNFNNIEFIMKVIWNDNRLDADSYHGWIH